MVPSVCTVCNKFCTGTKVKNGHDSEFKCGGRRGCIMKFRNGDGCRVCKVCEIGDLDCKGCRDSCQTMWLGGGNCTTVCHERNAGQRGDVLLARKLECGVFCARRVRGSLRSIAGAVLVSPAWIHSPVVWRVSRPCFKRGVYMPPCENFQALVDTLEVGKDKLQGSEEAKLYTDKPRLYDVRIPYSSSSSSNRISSYGATD